MKRRIRRIRRALKRAGLYNAFHITLIAVLLTGFCVILFNVKEPEQQEEKPETTQAEVIQNPETMTQTAESIEDKYKVFDTMSEDWGSDDLEGFVFYDLPEKYADKGYFPEKMQIYTRCLCKQNDVPYAIVLAIIEYESGYEFDKTGDNGNSKGYMQIYEKWHTDRMQKLNCTDLMNPYQNVKVGIDFLSYLLKKYGTVQDALAAYNYGENASTEIARAKANGAGWNIGSWSKRNLLNCMLKIMSKTDNSQTAFGQGQTSGYVNDASQNYGHLATGTLKDKGQFFGYNDTTHEVKVFYMEKPWGNRWDRINGLLMVGGEILAKMTPPYNLTGKDFEKVGITFTSSGNGYQKGTKSSRFGRIVNSIGGSSSTYTCDYFWWNAGITAVALVGGSCDSGEYCGADCLGLHNSAGNAYWYIGASVFLEQPIAA